MLNLELLDRVAVRQPCHGVGKADAVFRLVVLEPHLNLLLALVIDHGDEQMGFGVEIKVDQEIADTLAFESVHRAVGRIQLAAVGEGDGKACRR